jgi:glycosyltransferase involved in cell wall biosynthesis
MRWDILAGEYPPDRGGVADYTEVLAGGLAAAGCDVRIWVAGASAARHADPRVSVHGIGGPWRGTALKRLESALDRHGPDDRVLVQYAPRAFGMHGLNLPFCTWARGLGRRRNVRVMFHEPFFPFGWQRPQRNVLAAVNRAMAASLLAAGDPAYVSVPGWEPLLRPYVPAGRRFTWLPVPSAIPVVAAAPAVASLRAGLGGGPVVGHFGTYGDPIAALLLPALTEVLRTMPEARVLLLGTGGAEFAAQLAAADSSIRDRIHAPGRLEARDVSVHVQACDAAVQLYPDGVSSRRTTAMAWLAHGVPVVTTAGRFTEPVWQESGAVAVAPHGDTAAAARAVAELVRDRAAARGAGNAGRTLYDARFAIGNTVRILMSDAELGAMAAP